MRARRQHDIHRPFRGVARPSLRRQPRSAFPRDAIADELHKQVIQTIYDPSFVFQLPQLSDATWDVLCYNDEERERLEFVGDALMGALVAQQLYESFQLGTPYLYTIARMALVANSTFAHLMTKLGFHDMSDPIKPAGDAFEAVIAAYHRDEGPDALRVWVEQNYTPLIEIAGKNFSTFCKGSKKQRQRYRLSSTIKKRSPFIYGTRSTQKRPRIDRFQIPSSNGSRSISCTPQTRQSEVTLISKKGPPVVIDLSTDSDWEDEDDTGIQEIPPPPVFSTLTPTRSSNRFLTSQEVLRSISRRPVACFGAEASSPIASTCGSSADPIVLD